MWWLTPRVSRAFLAAVIVASVVVGAVPSTVAGAGEATPQNGDETAAAWTGRSGTDGRAVRVASGPAEVGSNAGSQADPPVINATYAFERTAEPGVVTVRVTYDASPSVTGLVVDPASRNSDRLTVTDTTGFTERPEGDRFRWEREESPTETPSIRMRYAVNESSDVFGGLNFVDTGSWALFDPPRPVLDGYRSRAGRATFDRAVVVAAEETGYATPEMVYLGRYERTNETRHGQEFVVVTPAAATQTNASAILDTLGAATRLYDVPRRDERVVAFVGPEPLREGGVGSGADGSRTDSIWVASDLPADSPTYVHEYIHTRQEFETTDRAAWIVEAQASYYDQLLSLYRGTTTYREFYTAVATAENADRRLAPENRTADTLAADYTKGARVLAALDAKIRTATGRNASLADVFRRLNRHEGRVSDADFKDAVTAVAGQRFDGWLDRHLTTPDAPAVPRNQSRYAPTQPGIDSDGDGLDTAAELDNGTDPFAADTDGDGFDDREELRRGTDPLSSADSPERTEPTLEPTPEAGASQSEGTTPADDSGDTASEGGESEDDASDDDEMGTGIALAVIGSLLATGVFGVGAIGAGAAKLLDRRIGIEIGFLTRRSVIGLVLLSTASLAVFIVIVVVVG